MSHLRILLTSVIAIFVLSAGQVRAQELITTLRNEITTLSVNDIIHISDPLYLEEQQQSSSYKVDRRFRTELIYNRKSHSDVLNGTEWRLSVTLENTATSESETLVIESTAELESAYSAWADFDGNSHEMEWEVTAITPQKFSLGVWVSANMNELPEADIHLECMVFNDRIVELDDTACPKMSLVGEYLNWEYIQGAVEYDVEWVFIDELDNFTYSSQAPEGPFRFKEPVRITTYKHRHRLDLIYPTGTVYFRIRPKGYFFSSSSDHEVYYAGDWCYIKKGTTSTNLSYAITSSHEEAKNWSYQVSYAENGLSKSNVTYYDGTLRGRQSLSRMRSSGQVVAGATVYDYEGRQAVQIIPTPIEGGSLDYYNKLHKDNLGGVFDKEDFDEGTSNPLGTSDGAGNYYSSDNDFTTAEEPFRDRIPNADGYPYTQTIFINDNTGRPRMASGIGETHKIGGGHESHFFYVKPTERNLRELFGSNVGHATHYDKQIAVDPNGQAIVTYTDQLGRVIAKGLYGDAPDNLIELDNNPYGEPAWITSSLDSLNIMSLDALGNMQSITDYYHMNIGSNDITLTYNLASAVINNNGSLFGTSCASCFYELEIHVYDPTGAEVDLDYLSSDMNTYSYVYEKFSEDQLNCANSTFTPSPDLIVETLSLTLTGEYQIKKILRVDAASVSDYIANNMTSLSTAPDSGAIASTYLSNIVTTGCGFDCDAYFEQECREEYGFPISGTLTSTQQDSVDACIATKCDDLDLEVQDDLDSLADNCNMLLGMLKGDVSPGGWVFEDDLDWRNDSNNWDQNYTKSGGGTFNPTDLQDLENNWEYQWADDLVESHPEYCHYEKCTTLVDLKEFNNELYGVTTWSDAKTLGYVSSTTYDFQQNGDPLYTHALYSSSAGTWLSNINSDYQNTNDNIEEYVINDLFVNYPDLAEDAQGNALTGTDLDNRKWEAMRSIFLGERENFIELNYSGCDYYDHSSANFVDPSLMDTLDTFYSGYLAPVNVSCPEVCNLNVQYWLGRIEDECPTLTAVQLDSISTHLQNYCLTDCDGIFNVAGAIQLSDLILAPVDPYLDSVESILSSACSFSLEAFAEVDTCSNMVADTVNNLYGYNADMQKKLAALTSIAENNHGLFITSPAITEISGYATKFSSSHWDTNMDLKLTDASGGTPVSVTYDVHDVSSVSIIGDTVDLLTGDIVFDVRVIENGGTVNVHPMNKFSLYTSSSTWHDFSVDVLDRKYTLIDSICADTLYNPLHVPFDLQTWIDDCVEDIEQEAIILANQEYQDLLEQLESELLFSFASNCFGSGLEEHLSISCNRQEYAFTLFYYDQAGNLVQTVPPQGCHIVPANAFDAGGNWDGTTEPEHKMKTMYTYNSLGQMIKAQTPDGGKTDFYFNSAQQMRFSQNDFQAITDDYSYSRYDELGRSIEAGVTKITAFTTYFDSYKDNNAYPQSTVGNPNSEVVRTYYEEQPLNLEPLLGWDPKELNTRIAAIAYYESFDGDQDDYSSASYYNYDIHGNVQELLNDHPLMGDDQRYKTVEYDYDLYNGNVNQVIYQKGEQDQFIHRYTYDDDNRLVSSETSRDGISWDEDAEYFYFLHGPLARMELGEDKVQGKDFTYTEHGWIKGVNNNTLEARRDMGRDGAAIDDFNKWNAQDAMGFNLTYYQGDYDPIVAQTVVDNKWFADGESSFMPGTGADLYNGNIRAMVTAIGKTDNTTLDIYAKVYQYDQLQRIKEAKTYESANLIANNKWNGGAFTDAYYSDYEFDLNGNLTKLQRNGSGNIPGGYHAMDDFTYNYYDNDGGNPSLPEEGNRLAQVTDYSSTDAFYANDINSGQSTSNYRYDAIGRLIVDGQEEIGDITWTVTNKVAYIDRSTGSTKSDVEFKYDPLGNRIAKIERPNNGGQIQWTFYVRDAQGNLMATYNQYGSTPTSTLLEGHDIYGASRIGNYEVNENLSTSEAFDYCSMDNRASAIIELKLSTFSNGDDVEYKIGTRSLNDEITWGTTLETNVTNLLNAINAKTSVSDVSASLWWSNNPANTYYVELKYAQPGNWNGQSLDLYVNSSSTSHTPKRELGYGACDGKNIVGARRYELANHLNNVLAVITDRKFSVDNGTFNSTTGAQTSTTLDGIVDCYEASIVAYSDYYPYGMLMDDRHESSSNYDYGFQGMEDDDEIAGEGNNLTAEYWQYDTRLGRRWNIDPVIKYHESPYAAFANNPIIFIDPNGADTLDAVSINTWLTNLKSMEDKIAKKKKALDQRRKDIDNSEWNLNFWETLALFDITQNEVDDQAVTQAFEILDQQMDDWDRDYEELKGLVKDYNEAIGTVKGYLDEADAVIFGVYSTAAAGVLLVHKNSNNYVGPQAVYKIQVDGKVYKFGKADLTNTSVVGDEELPKRLADQVRRLRRTYKDVKGTVIYSSSSISTYEIKQVETKAILGYYRKYKKIPYGNKAHKKYGPRAKRPHRTKWKYFKKSGRRGG